MSHFKDGLVYPYKDFLGRRPPRSLLSKKRDWLSPWSPSPTPSCQQDAPAPGSNYSWWGWPQPFPLVSTGPPPLLSQKPLFAHELYLNSPAQTLPPPDRTL